MPMVERNFCGVVVVLSSTFIPFHDVTKIDFRDTGRPHVYALGLYGSLYSKCKVCMDTAQVFIKDWILLFQDQTRRRIFD